MIADYALARLAWARPLERRETAVGYASRAACLNGRRLSVLLREMLIPPRDLDRAVPTALNAIATLGGVDTAELARFSPAPALDQRYQTVAGETLLRHSVSRTYFRYCPACVADDLERFDGRLATRPWLRLEWTIPHFRSCPEHRLPLRQATPVRRGFEPFDFSETMAALIGDGSAVPSDQSQAPASPFQDWLLARLDGDRDGKGYLDDLSLHVGVSLCEAFGVSELHPPKIQTSKLTRDDWAAAADAGFRTMSGGEPSVRELLRELNDAQRNTRGVWAPRDTFGYAYGLLQKTVYDPAYGKVRDLVRSFAIENMPLEPGANVLGETVAERAIHTIHSAAKASGVHARSMRSLFARQGLATVDGIDGLRDHRVTANAGHLTRIVDTLRDAISGPRVTAITGIPKNHLTVLIADGHLPTLTNTVGLQYAKHRFSPKAVDELKRRLFAGAEMLEGETERRVTIATARLMAGATVGSVLRMVLDGSLTWKGRIGHEGKYDTLLVDADELTGLVRREAPRTNFTKEEVADAIPGVDRRHVDRLATAGLLELVEEFSPEARRMIPVVSRASADAFLARFVTLGELTRTSGLHHKKVRLLLRGAGIDAAVDPDACEVFVYERSAVDRAVAARPGFWAYDKVEALRAARVAATTPKAAASTSSAVVPGQAVVGKRPIGPANEQIPVLEKG